jgi:hypothetical protein
MRHRSDKDHAMHRALIRKAFQNWPEDHRFQPDDEDHLYGWLLIEAGAKACVEVESKDVDVAKAVARGIFEVTKRRIHCMRIFPAGDTGLRICVPDSLAYEEAGKRKFEETRRAVYEIIETTLGVKIETLKRARVAE